MELEKSSLVNEDMNHYCTYFDHHYLARGLALYRSLRRHSPSFRLWVLCLDSLAYRLLSQLALPNLILLPLEDLERGDPALLAAKRNRKLLEYYFTCTPLLPLFILDRHHDVPMITYLDADLFFFSDPAPIYEEIGEFSIAIIGHRFPEHLRHLEIHGVYNVGWLSFRRSAEAFLCLQRWREQCIQWCTRRPENDRYADQKYLDEWPTLYKGLVVLRHKGANLAPWNLANYNIEWDEDRVWVDAQPLIFYHFHGLHPLQNWFYDSEMDRYSLKPSWRVMRRIYLPYIQSLKRETRSVSNMIKSTGIMEGKDIHHLLAASFRSVLGTRTRNPLRRALHMGKGMLTRKYLFVVGNCIL